MTPHQCLWATQRIVGYDEESHDELSSGEGVCRSFCRDNGRRSHICDRNNRRYGSKYAIDVLQLAQSHKVASDVLPEDAKFGAGKLQISLGDDTFDVNVRSSSKLVDVVRGINGAKDNPGVRASVINDVEGPRLILASNLSGKDHQIKVSVDAEAGNPSETFRIQNSGRPSERA